MKKKKMTVENEAFWYQAGAAPAHVSTSTAKQAGREL